MYVEPSWDLWEKASLILVADGPLNIRLYSVYKYFIERVSICVLQILAVVLLYLLSLPGLGIRVMQVLSGRQVL